MRIAIVNDLRIATEALKRVIEAGGHQLAWTAVDGVEGVDKYRNDKPDLILMDLVMPNMDGAEATRQINQIKQVPILVVTSSVAANFNLATKAMGYGAIDVVLLPEMRGSPAKDGASLLGRLKNIEEIGKGRDRGSSVLAPKLDNTVAQRGIKLPLIVIGCSTGGPAALEKILTSLPKDFPAAIMVIQHIGSEFCESFSRWLNRPEGLPVSLARDGSRPVIGQVLVAMSHAHLVMRRDGTLAYSVEPKDNPFVPSIDVFMESCALNWGGGKGIAGILTGIGRDGAKGLLALKRAGWITFAQDAETSVVYGMPKVAAEQGGAQTILPIGDVEKFLKNNVTGAMKS